MKPKLILGVTVGGSSRLLDGQVSYFLNLGYDVYLMSPPHPKERLFCEREGCKHLPVDIVKDINIRKDLIALMQIIRYLKALRPDIVNVGTPKMGLLGIMGAYITGVKHRIYTCRGFRFETETGLLRKILIFMEKLTVFLAYKVIYVSPSLKNAAELYRTGSSKKSVLLGNGSSNGVDIKRFSAHAVSATKREELIRQYQLQNHLIIGYVGRVSVQKGSFELVRVFENLYQSNKQLKLIMIGHDDSPEDFRNNYMSHPGIIHIPFQDDVPLYMSLFDIFVLPSWREGFPNVPIQAAAMGIPVIVSNATGCIDAVDNNSNGVVFQVKNEKSLKEVLHTYISNENLRKEHGRNGIAWAAMFENSIIWNALNNLYTGML
ncbi:MAG: glycosyltransferase family 4 protein [Paludibacter sp.]|nr:glycosyltransferase family 4 protein [Paludibacter sp.]